MFAHFRYTASKGIRTAATAVARSFLRTRELSRGDIRDQKIEKILLVRANFRIGNSILAIPGIRLFRHNFPNARIDFVGSPVSKILFQNLPIDNHYQVARDYAKCGWAYPVLVRKLRSFRYDLAVELSCSQSALGSFIVGMSGARVRAGRKGKWDFWFNWRVPKPAERNKYRVLPAFVASMGLQAEEIYPTLILSQAEKQAALTRINANGEKPGPIVAVFVGARERFGKRWAPDSFLRLITNLVERGLRTVVFLGPEERELITLFRRYLKPDVPVIYEGSLRLFVAMISNCQLFVTCDSGPMHVACALGVRTIAVFQNADFNRWGPPSHLARIVYDPQGVSVEMVEHYCMAELSQLRSRPNSGQLSESANRLGNSIQ